MGDESNTDIFRMVAQWKESPDGEAKNMAANYLIGYLTGAYLRERKRTSAGLRMRRAQRAYFLGRSGPNRRELLQAAFDAEKEYDLLVMGAVDE